MPKPPNDGNPPELAGNAGAVVPNPPKPTAGAGAGAAKEDNPPKADGAADVVAPNMLNPVEAGGAPKVAVAGAGAAPNVAPNPAHSIHTSPQRPKTMGSQHTGATHRRIQLPARVLAHQRLHHLSTHVKAKHRT